MAGESNKTNCCSHCKNDGELVYEIRLLSQELKEMKLVLAGAAENRWMTTREAAEYARVSIKKISRAVKSGKLKCGNRDGHWRFKHEWIDKYIINN